MHLCTYYRSVKTPIVDNSINTNMNSHIEVLLNHKVEDQSYTAIEEEVNVDNIRREANGQNSAIRMNHEQPSFMDR